MARKKRIDHHPVVKTFAARLRATRRERGMSQMALAHRSLVTYSYIGKLERAEAAAGIDMLGRLADALGVNPAMLITDVKNPTSSLPVVREQIQRHVKKLLGRDAEESLQAIAVVMGLLDNAVARQG